MKKLLLPILVATCIAQGSSAQPNFANRVKLSNNATTVFMADLDNDSDLDVGCVEGGKHAGGTKVFAWYENNGDGTWSGHDFNSSKPGPFTGDTEPYDMNGDGWMDFVITVDNHGNGSNSHVYWYENPQGNAQGTWTQHTIYDLPSSWNNYHQQGLDIIDFDKDGKVDVCVRSLGDDRCTIYYQNSLSSWTPVFVENSFKDREGQYCADLNGDTYSDIILNGYWYENPTNRTGTWTQRTIDAQYYNASNSGLNNSVKALAKDIDGDNDLDVYFSSAEGNSSDLAWFENNNGNGTSWTKHIIASNFDKNHQAILEDVDGDGDLDVYGGKSFGSTGVFIFTNDNGQGTSWTQHWIDTGSGTGFYSAVAGDADNDGDIDVVGPWKYTEDVYYYQNQTVNVPTVDAISITPSGGNYSTPPTIIMSTTTPNTDIYYTDDGTDPDQSDMLYAGGFAQGVSATIKARGYATGLLPSGVSSETYNVAIGGNFPPVADAGSGGSGLTNTTFILDGSGTTDIDDPIGTLMFTWTQTGGPSVSIQNSNDMIASFVPTVVGTYTFNLNVSDGQDSDNDQTSYNVIDVQGLVHHWPLDETSGNTAPDIVGSAHGTLVNSPTWQPSSGQFGGAIEFDGSNEWIDAGNFNVTGSGITMSAWVNPSATSPTEGRIITKADGISANNHDWMLSFINGTNLRIRIKTTGNTATLSSSGNLIPLNQWTHVVGTFDGSFMKLYIDGQEVASTAKTGSLAQSSKTVSIGNSPTADRPCIGMVDDVQLYDRALSLAEIQALFNPAPEIYLSVQMLLGGPYDNVSGLMDDNLRNDGHLPANDPYGLGESVDASVFNTTGNTAIVDWVYVQLRDKNDPSTVVASKAALLQRDGQVVGSDLSNTLTFPLAKDDHYVSVHHRNHLGAMLNVSTSFGAGTTSVDFSSDATYGTEAVDADGALWAGDALPDGEIKYTGTNNDRDAILTAIGGTVPTNTIAGYHGEDCNMDAAVKYTGIGNDRDIVLSNIGGAVPTNIRAEQLP